MRFKIEGKIKVEGKRKLQYQFIEKDFPDQESADLYAKEFCGSWKNIKIEEV